MRTRILAAISVAALSLTAVPFAAAASKPPAAHHVTPAAQLERSRDRPSTARPRSSSDPRSPVHTVLDD